MKKLRFNATFTDFLKKLLVWGLIGIFTFGIGIVWIWYDSTKWVIEHIEVE